MTTNFQMGDKVHTSTSYRNAYRGGEVISIARGSIEIVWFKWGFVPAEDRNPNNVIYARAYVGSDGQFYDCGDLVINDTPHDTSAESKTARIFRNGNDLKDHYLGKGKVINTFLSDHTAIDKALQNENCKIYTYADNLPCGYSITEMSGYEYACDGSFKKTNKNGTIANCQYRIHYVANEVIQSCGDCNVWIVYLNTVDDPQWEGESEFITQETIDKWDESAYTPAQEKIINAMKDYSVLHPEDFKRDLWGLQLSRKAANNLVALGVLEFDPDYDDGEWAYEFSNKGYELFVKNTPQNVKTVPESNDSPVVDTPLPKAPFDDRVKMAHILLEQDILSSKFSPNHDRQNYLRVLNSNITREIIVSEYSDKER